ncbi:tryptophan synthase subunit alpha [Nitratifractor sp.]
MKRLVAYITTGYPDSSFTVDLALALAEAGVDTLELGIPFSDPVADGPVIESANLRALQRGFRLRDLFEASRQIAPKIDTLWMGYFNPFYHRGIGTFVDEAVSAGVHGFIIPDLPYEEARPYKPQIEEAGLALIDFIAPTDTPERITMIARDARKFLYLVAYAGITGSGRSEELTPVLEKIREATDTPVYLGFGVTPETAKEKARNVDGVIVGSAFVKVLLDESLNNTEKIGKISAMAREIKERINE